MIKIGLFAALVIVLLLLFFYKKINLSTIIISAISFAMVSITAVIGLSMKSTSIFFMLHNFAIMLATGAILYYMITKKYIFPIILLPIFTLALYVATAYTSGAKYNIFFG